MKWFISKVLPGVDDVFAKFLWRHNMFIREDFPTLLLPMKAYSFFVSLGHVDTVGELMTYSDVFISIIVLVLIKGKTAQLDFYLLEFFREFLPSLHSLFLLMLNLGIFIHELHVRGVLRVAKESVEF